MQAHFLFSFKKKRSVIFKINDPMFFYKPIVSDVGTGIAPQIQDFQGLGYLICFESKNWCQLHVYSCIKVVFNVFMYITGQR